MKERGKSAVAAQPEVEAEVEQPRQGRPAKTASAQIKAGSTQHFSARGRVVIVKLISMAKCRMVINAISVLLAIKPFMSRLIAYERVLSSGIAHYIDIGKHKTHLSRSGNKPK